MIDEEKRVTAAHAVVDLGEQTETKLSGGIK